ncbi:hypothetical protein MH117_01945 [Paenibacillus sp. ACRRX]|uniref:hypothetical protein n=1 Tax=Paenibacillus sp. ACRRX TaxID=2918206 RepID=UPI001EF5293D|nr:hypothetical protein [Paenibacillus sp. ACRRX]MCG7406161.1 hypothetical protein [Paenibacillus sp. ACRRX]
MRKMIIWFLVSLFAISMCESAYALSVNEYIYDSNGKLKSTYNYDNRSKVEYNYNSNGNVILKKHRVDAPVPVFNRLSNSNFDSFINGVVEKWDISKWDVPKAEFKEVEHLGAKAQSVRCSEMKNNGYCGISQVVAVQPNQPYTLRVSMDIQELHESRMQLYVDYYDQAQKFISVNVQELKGPIKVDYVTFSLRGNIPANASTARVYVLSRSESDNGQAAFYIRNAEFRYGMDSNLLSNGSVDGTSGQEVADLWTRVGWDIGMRNTNVLEYDNNYVQEVIADQISENGVAGISQVIHITPSSQSTQFKVSGSFNIVRLKHSYVQLYVDFKDDNGRFVGAYAAPYFTNTNGNAITISEYGQVPATATHAVVYALIRGQKANSSGHIQVDNLRFVYNEPSITADEKFDVYHNGDLKSDYWDKVVWSSDSYDFQLRQQKDKEIAQYISGKAIKANGIVGVVQKLAIVPLRNFKATSDLRISHLDHAKVQLYIDFFNVDNQFVGASIVEGDKVTGTTPITLTTAGKMPEQAAYAFVYILIRGITDGGEGEILVDNVKMAYQ